MWAPACVLFVGGKGTNNLPDKHDKAILGLEKGDANMVFSAMEEDLRQGMDQVRQDLMFTITKTS